MGILIFLVILGTMVCMMNHAGGSAAFGRWAQQHIKSRVGAQLITISLGVIIFIDDYFNCLTVGSVMRPVTDKQKISREKLAYLIDATAAPVCINGQVIDLIFPIAVLIISCVLGMIYTGGFFSGESFVDAFAGSDASVGLVIGSMAAMLITMAFFSIRKVISFKECVDCLPRGFQAMIPAILILSMAWTLKAMTDSLGAKEYVEMLVGQYATGFTSFLPALIFVIAALLAFATGTSWGTFGILIPIVVSVFQKTDITMMIISISACMAGAVCGDHCSPISDTTIMASAGAQCDHVNHVSTQLPYVLVVAAISFVNYVIVGFVRNAAVGLLIGIILTIIVLAVLKAMSRNESR